MSNMTGHATMIPSQIAYHDPDGSWRPDMNLAIQLRRAFGETVFNLDALGGGTNFQFTYRGIVWGLFENLTPEQFDGDEFLLAPIEDHDEYNQPKIEFGAEFMTFGVTAQIANFMAVTCRVLIDNLDPNIITQYNAF